MANVTNSNPMMIDTAAVLWSKKPTRVRLIQWVDDAGDIVDDSTLVLTVNGIALTTKLQLAANISNYGVVVWQMGPFNPGLNIDTLGVTTMATGNLHVWLE
jgi:hypothetical protein